MTSKDVCIVIAAYNESAVVGDVVKELVVNGYRVILTDDGSKDETASIASGAGAMVVRHPINLGQGAALQTGIAFALMQDCKYIVTFDADGQHQVSDVGIMISLLQKSGADIACGSRFLGRAVNISLVRIAFLRLAIVFTFVTTGMRMTDAHNGFRAMTTDAARKIRIRQNRMAHASEIISEISRNNLKYIEVPVTIQYTLYSLYKGQKLSNSINIVADLLFRKVFK